MDENQNTVTEIEVKIKVRNETTGALDEVLSTVSKLSKEDAPEAGDKTEDAIYISIAPGSLPKYADAVISVNFSGKLTKADAG